MITAYIFMAFTFTGFALAIFRGPFWGVLVYMNIYFNNPNPMINWWAKSLPDLRWSLLSSIVLLVSIIIHRNKISHFKLYSLKWVIAFFVLTVIITLKGTVAQDDASLYAYMLFTYCITIYCFMKSIKFPDQYRLLLLAIVGFASHLSLKAFLYGERVHARLENIGAADTLGSNEFALLLTGIIPLTLPFIISGKKYEKIICILALPFLLNAFILCNSRGAFVAFALAILTVFVFLADKKIRKVIVIGALCTAPLFYYLADEYFIERLSTLLGTQDAMSDETEIEQLSSGRTAIWKYGLEIAKDHPFGAGPNSFKRLAKFYMPPEMLTIDPVTQEGQRSAHNTYLQVLVEQGFIGLILFMLICAHTLMLLFRCLKALKNKNLVDQFWKYAMVALGLSFLSILFGGLFASRVYYEFFWWQIALSVLSYSFIIKAVQDASEVHGPDFPRNNEHNERLDKILSMEV
jgi:O-antigen ligase